MEQKNQAGKIPANKINTSKSDNNIRVVSVYVGTKTASEAFHNAAIKKILCEKVKIS